MRISTVLLAVLTLAWPRVALSQVSTTPIPLGPAVDTGRPLEELDELTKLYDGGRWDELQIKAQALLVAAATKATALPDGKAIQAGLDFRKNYVVVVWIGTDAFGKTMLARAVVHAPAASEPFSADLPGVGTKASDPHVYEAFLGRGVRGKLVSVYASSRDKDPLADTVPAFVQAIASPFFSTFGALAGSKSAAHGPAEAAPAKPQPPPVSVTVARVGLPFERATIKWKASAKEPADVDAFSRAADALVQDLTFSEVPNSPCARVVAAALGEGLKNAAAGPQCTAATATTAGCLSHFDKLISDAEAQGLKDPACAGASKADLSAVEKLDAKVREFASAGMTTVADADLSFKNRPLTHWSFGAGSGVLTSASLTLPRVNVKDDVFVADPLSRLVTTSFVNWSCSGYDADLDEVSDAERARPFFGVTMTPDFGLTAGVNVFLTHGIGVTVGGVVMFAKGAAKDEIGKAPANPDKPYALSYARGVLAGISYNFK